MSEGTSLRKSLGLVDATALVVGCTIGAGIFRMAAPIAGQLSTVGLVMAIWIIGGLVSFCGALCYAELGAAYPRTGGDYVYLSKAYGPAVGFLFGWTKLFTERIGTIAILGFVFAEYLGFLFNYGPIGTRLAATGAILFLSGANILGIEVGKGFQNVLTALKILGLSVIVGLGFASGQGDPTLLRPWWPESVGLKTFQAMGVALVFVLWTYGGWAESTYVAEEMKNPRRTLPWSILFGLGLVTALYLLVNWVYLLYIPLNQMPGRPLVAAEVMRAILGPLGGGATALMVACSAFGALNGFILTSGRILLALGRDHSLFSRLAEVSPWLATPAWALAFNGLAALGLVWTGTFDQIVTYSTVVISIFFAMTAFAVILLRIRDPETPRPYRVWGYPVTPILFVLAIGLFVVDVTFMQPQEALLGFGLLALGVPLYLWSRALRKPGGGLIPFEGVRPLLVFVFFFAAVNSTQAAGPSDPFLEERQEMVREQIQEREVKDRRVLEAMRRVPRHEFVPKAMRAMAYMDGPLPIGEGQTISQPYIVALMTELAEVGAGEKVLEIGTGSGYQAAVLAELTPKVYTIEIVPSLAARAKATLERLGYTQVKTRVGDGYLGWPEEAPFDAILCTAAPDHVPQPLIDQLAEGGILVIPVGPRGIGQILQRIRKKGGQVTKEEITPVAFVPLIHER